MTVVPFVHVSLILVSALAFHVCMSPPTGAVMPSSPERAGSEERDLRIYTTARFVTGLITKGFYWASAVTDALVLLAPHVPPSILIPTATSAGPLRSWTQALVSQPTSSQLLTAIGAILVLTGTLLRTAAYRALGQFYACPPGPGPCPSPYRGPGPYTRQGARHAHALITSGPYSLLRHPGYAGLLLSTIGFFTLHLDTNVGLPSWEIGTSVGYSVNVGQVCAGMRAVALAAALLGAVSAIRRIQDEEHALRGRFKMEWELWAERVRYKLVPGVY